MSGSLSPLSSSKNALRFSSKSLRNSKLHAALDEAKNYSDLVNIHLVRSTEENHVLATATEAYRNRVMSRSRSTLFRHRIASRDKSVKSSKQIFNPESPDMTKHIQDKSKTIPTIGERFKESLCEKQALEHRAQELKALIAQQRKLKDRIYINNCRLINSLENAQKTIKANDEKSHKNTIIINECQNDVSELYKDLLSNQRENRKVLKKIQEQSANVSDLSQVVSGMKQFLQTQTHELATLKSEQTKNYKGMTNAYMLLNQRKEEKALFLNHIHMDVAKNS